MEAVVYRKDQPKARSQEPQTGDQPADSWSPGRPTPRPAAGPLSPALFYPLVTAPEMITWTYWLPTSLVFERTAGRSPTEVLSTLSRLKAPPEVLEEFQWSWKLDVFEAYEVRTPVRRDYRDPVLLGRAGGQTYRLALWGESLLPLEQMTALVQQSFAVRARAAKRRVWWGLGGSLPGLALASWLGTLVWAGHEVGAGPLLALLFLVLAWLPLLVYTPENCQHDFLDRYRR
jgi:hypothetical protein